MKTLTIALLILAAGVAKAAQPRLSTTENSATASLAAARTSGTASAYADTQTEAYAKARAKVPEGAKELSTRFNKSGSKWFCQIRWEKE